MNSQLGVNSLYALCVKEREREREREWMFLCIAAQYD